MSPDEMNADEYADAVCYRSDRCKVGGVEYGTPMTLSTETRTRKSVLANDWQSYRCRHAVDDDDDADGYAYGDDGLPEVLGRHAWHPSGGWCMGASTVL